MKLLSSVQLCCATFPRDNADLLGFLEAQSRHGSFCSDLLEDILKSYLVG